MTNGTTASRRRKTKRPDRVELEGRRNPIKEEEKDSTVDTVLKLETNILTIRCYIYRLTFEFIFVMFIFIYSYTVCTLIPRRKGECDMMSFHVLNYIRAKNSSTDNLVPANSTTI